MTKIPALALALAALLCLILAPAPAAQAQEAADPTTQPRFLRVSHFDGQGYVLHGIVEPGTQIELIAVTGTGRCTATVPDSSAETLETMNGPVDITRLGNLPQCGLGDIAVAVSPPPRELEDLYLPPVYPGYDASPFFAPARDAVMAEGDEFFGYAFDDSSKVSGFLDIQQDDAILNFLLYKVADTSGGASFTDAQILVAVTPTSAQAFKLGCNSFYKLFRLDGRLYLVTKWQCCSCGGNGYHVYAWHNDQFTQLLENWDLDS